MPSEDILWLAAATKHFRVFLLDQRGTGCSAPLRASTLQPVGSVERQVEHLRHFRADSIVADAEAFRRALDTQTGEKKRWCILGQSFGGFCCVNYLSTAPDGSHPIAPDTSGYSAVSVAALGWLHVHAAVCESECHGTETVPCSTSIFTLLQGSWKSSLQAAYRPCIDDACPLDTVYQATFRRVLVQNQKFYTRFPQDVQVRP